MIVEHRAGHQCTEKSRRWNAGVANLRKLFAYKNVQDCSTHVRHTQNIPTWLLNSVPRSVMIVQLPYRQYKLYKKGATETEDLSTMAVASGHFVK